MRKLKFHEKKLLKRVDLYNWKKDKEHREVKIMRRYHIQDRDDYTRYIINVILDIIKYVDMLHL